MQKKESILKCGNMILTWEPCWYELDQTIIVGDIDYFYFDRDERTFANGFPSSEDKEVRGEKCDICHFICFVHS
jgi:hypothetical protein